MTRKETHLLTQFHKEVYQQIDKRADAVMDLLHAMCSEARARSVAELSLHPVCRRGHDSLYKAIREAGMTSEKLRHLAARVLPQPQERAYWLVSTDTTPCPREWSRTLPERGYVYAPSAVPGRAPITIGYTFSTVAVHPEREADAPIWALPVACERVRAEASPVLVGAAQLQALMSDPEMPWHGQQKALVVHVADSTYSQKAFVPAAAHPDLVHVLRVRTNRLFYAPASRPAHRRRGRPRLYGQPFRLNDPATWWPPDQVVEWEQAGPGRSRRVQVHVWYTMLMKGLADHPFTLLKVLFLDEAGQPCFQRPWWLMVVGARRDEVHPHQAVEAYQRRFDHEHLLRFCTQRLLLTAFQTISLPALESWWCLVFLAYLLLWAARPVAQATWRPWERYAAHRHRSCSPSLVQRDFDRILTTLGLLLPAPQPRGKSPGRPPGTRLPPRQRHNVVKKRRQRRRRRSKQAA